MEDKNQTKQNSKVELLLKQDLRHHGPVEWSSSERDHSIHYIQINHKIKTLK